MIILNVRFERFSSIGFLQGLLLGALMVTLGRGQDAAALGEILGSNAANWKLSQPGTMQTLDGRSVLFSKTGPISFFNTDKFTVDTEYQAVIRMVPITAGSPATFSVQLGLNGPDDPNPTPLSVELSALTGAPGPNWYISGGSQKWSNTGSYLLRAVTTPSLAWPENLRKSVEADMAKLPDLNHKWLTLRCVVRADSIKTYLDDRLVDVRAGTAAELAGNIRIVLSPEVSLASFRAKPLPPEDPLFRPVALDGFVNASLLNGKAVDHSNLPAPGKITLVGGVPFVFPQPDDLGRDHISLAGSWAQFGNLETYIESYDGEFHGRWPTALTVNPARIQVRVPNDHYNRLYVIAAASDEPNSVPVMTAQFYKGYAGFPKSYKAKVPLFSTTASNAVKLPAKLQHGSAGSLYLVTIDLDPGQLAELGSVTPGGGAPDQPATAPHQWDGHLQILDLELTKGVEPYRNYPDPNCHSVHQAGLPSSVHLYALTLGRTPLRMTFAPDKFAGVWTAPATPSYTVTLGNRTAAPRNVELTLTTTSHDGSEKTEQKQTVTVPPGDVDTLAKFPLGVLQHNGYHDVLLTMKDGADVWTETRSLARLPADTRERGNWAEGKGPIMGYWSWGGAHDTPDELSELKVMADAGAEICTADLSLNSTPPEALAFAKDHQFANVLKFISGGCYDFAFAYPPLTLKWASGNRAEASAALLDALTKIEIKGPIAAGNLVPFFPEPGIGLSTYINQPEYWGEPPYKLSPEEEKSFKVLLDKFLVGAHAVRQQWPDAKILLPYGDPCFCIPFLRYSDEVRQLIDGVFLDMPAMDRLPEAQLHQVVQGRLYEMLSEFHKYGKKPILATCEATCVPTFAGGLTWDEQANIHTRNMLMYFAYGVYQQASAAYPFDCAGYWGEEQYGAAGLFHRMPNVAPKPSYVAYATMTRHLNRANFTKWVPTGSGSTYALQFKHYQTGKLIHVLWTIRGERPVTLAVPTGAQVIVYDQDDNAHALTETNGTVSFTIDASPCYVEGLTSDAAITLGLPDHSDSQPAAGAIKLSNLGDGTWKKSDERDLAYESNNPLQIARFPGKMSTTSLVAPAEQGGKALAVHLEKQEKERLLMPYYTSLVPDHPILIPGKGSDLGLWVHASSDWGRVVYCLRDAQGQRWLSIGTKESWNCDDTEQWSSFCFDGWRYLRFALPSNAPYDNFREQGSTWWGHSSPGEGTVHLPLHLEKIIVERRTHTLYVNDPQLAQPDDVLLGDLMAEYATPFDQTEGVIAQSRIQMPIPQGGAGLTNPIKDMATAGSGVPIAITHIDAPASEYDGTRGLVFFKPSPAAATYDVWVSPYADGSGAIQLATGWKEPGQLVNGLRPETRFYAFVTYTDKAGKVSKPSSPFPFTLKDMFPMK